MAGTASSIGPGFELKHRIAGAIILITFAVVVLPILLGGPKPSTPSVPVTETAPNGGNETDTQVFVSKITPIGGATPEPLAPLQAPIKSKSGPAKPAPSKDSQSSAPGESTPAPTKREAKPAVPVPKPQSTPVAKAPSEPVTPKPKTETGTKASELDRGWVVRVGTYSQSANAKRVMEALEKRGFNPSSGSVKTKTGVATRVWVGPFAQRVEAARTRTRIERATGQKGLIAAFP